MIRSKINPEPLRRSLTKLQRRVVYFNPEQLFKRITFDPYSRRNDLSLTTMFPKPAGRKCSCGCGRNLTGRQTRWATKDCCNFAAAVYFIISNDTATIKRYMSVYTPWECCACRCPDGHREYKNGLIVSTLEVDHKVAVKNGGGACWLGNYQLICHACHKAKTINDNRLRNTPTQLQPSPTFL